MVQRPASRSSSGQSAPRTSPLRAAVSARNSTARAAIPSRRPSAANQRAASSRARAGWLSAFATFPGFGSIASRFPFHLAGLSPVRWPATVAHERTASMRPRSARSRFGLVPPDGLEHPKHVGQRHVGDAHGAEDRAGVGVEGRAPLRPVLVVPELGQLRGEEPLDRLAEGRDRGATALRALSGSPPARAMRRFSRARSRARASETSGGLPSPSSHRLPRMTIRCTHWRAPLGCTRRKSPCPSKCFPGPAFRTSAAVSAFSGFRLPVVAIRASPIMSPRNRRNGANYAGSERTKPATSGSNISVLVEDLGTARKMPLRTSPPPSTRSFPTSAQTTSNSGYEPD